jgi:hypothetical protein
MKPALKLGYSQDPMRLVGFQTMRELWQEQLMGLILVDFLKSQVQWLDLTKQAVHLRRLALKRAQILTLARGLLNGVIPRPDEAGGEPDDPGTVMGPEEAGGAPEDTGTVTAVSLESYWRDT